MDNLSVIIPAAGIGRRMKSYGPKALIHLNNHETVITRQIRLLKSIYPNSEIVLVVGFEGDKIYKKVPYDVRITYNYKYEETNVAESLAIGISSIKNNNVLIVYGDLVFNAAAIISSSGNSKILIDRKAMFRRGEVGVTIANNIVSQFSYGLPTKWGQIVYLTGNELEIFKNILYNNKIDKFFGFEILNKMLAQGGRLETIEPQNIQIAEIDTSKDIAIAKRIT